MYVQSNSQACSRNHCCRGNVMNITYFSVCLYYCLCHPAGKSHIFCVALYCQLWIVWVYHIFPYINTIIIFEKNLLNIQCVLVFFKTFV